MPLSDLKIKATKTSAKAYKLSDGGGLFILIKPNGSKLWRLKHRFLGKEKVYAPGKYPLISLAEAREIRDKVKKTIMEGRDPTQQRRLETMRRMEAGENTFEAVARRWLAIKDTIETHRDRSLRRLELHAFPRLGARPIGEIKTLELALCLESVEKGGILETAHRVKQLIQQVFRYAIRRGIIEHNPAGDLRDIISHAPVQNFACIERSELPRLMRDI